MRVGFTYTYSILQYPTVSYSNFVKRGCFPWPDQGLCSGSAGARQPAADHQTGSGHTGPWRRRWAVGSCLGFFFGKKLGKWWEIIERCSKKRGSCMVGDNDVRCFWEGSFFIRNSWSDRWWGVGWFTSGYVHGIGTDVWVKPHLKEWRCGSVTI